ncbi:cytochrome c peroxidase [Chromobacterium vaccinii]|uniref:cytochrome c peroxidase n=1 Tax=Chromobacterium vaccinii TaxID=1108595 RepID=UPI003C70DC0B
MHRFAPALLSSLLLAGCSGGPAATPPQTGRFIDSAVSGLDYETPTRAGKTTDNGEFHYLNGETVTFRLGRLTLGAAAGSPVLTPLTLAGTQDASHPAALKIARLLLTLDRDDNPANGIQIDPADAARFQQAQKLAEIDDAQALLDQLGIGRSLVSAEYAQAHLQLSLAALDPQPQAARFQPRRDSDGQAVQTGDPAGCVDDRRTGLSWEAKTETGLRSRWHSYYASASRQIERPAQCEPGQEDCLAVTYVEAVNQQKLCGHDDWRLPSERELKTLLDWSQRDRQRNLPAIDRHAFPDAEAAFYWTATSRQGRGALAVAFDDSHRTLPHISLSLGSPARIRLVRGPALPDAPNPEDLPQTMPPYIPVDRDGELAKPNADAACVDDGEHPDAMFNVVLWQARPRDVQTGQVSSALSEANGQAWCGQRDWTLPSAADGSRWLQLRLTGDAAFRAAFPAAAATQAIWVKDNAGKARILRADGQYADVGSAALLAISKRSAKPPMPDSDDTPPDAATLAGWRQQYLRYRSGQAAQPDWPAPTLDADALPGFRDLGLLPAMPFPADNPYSPAKAALGEKLFFDVRLSRNDRIACASCHDPAHGWADQREVSSGHIGQLGGRNAPAIVNSGYAASLFWDGRAASLEQQALGPIANPLEMHQPLAAAAAKIAAAAEYPPLFAAAFGDARVDADRLARALATFERTLISHDSDFDRFLKGDAQALSDQALWGLQLFRTKARCLNCHNGPLLSDQRFHNLGLHFIGRDREDRGRGAVTGRNEDVGAFRTPGLRELLYTGDYMHSGDMPLFTDDGSGVLEFYNNGGNEVAAAGLEKYTQPKTSPLLKPLGLGDAEKRALQAFLQALSGPPRLRPAGADELFRR